MNLIAAGLSDVGQHREHNEDSYCVLPEHRLYIVADGMGGHRAGDIASKMATEAIADFFRASASEDSTWPFYFDPNLSVEENRLITSIKIANREIFETSAQRREVQGMGTTVVSALFSKNDNRLYVAHVGDSRAYRLRSNELVQLTRDHSLVNDYLTLMPDLTEEQRDELPKNVITRALGMQDTVTVDLVAMEAQIGDRYLLCSDGLSGMIPEEEIVSTIASAEADVETAVHKLVELANEHGGDDNVTSVLIAVCE